MATIPQPKASPTTEAIPDSASTEDVVAKLATNTASGLTQDEAASRLERYGPNAIEEKRVSPFTRFLAFFWGPIPWMIEVAAVLSAIVRHGKTS